jgi:lipopolysaccharide/colanic/teichoic acid biosynthesis glycosyltransferase
MTPDTDVYVLPPRYRSLAVRSQLVVKRLVDIAGAVVGLLVLSPLMAVIGMAVWSDSGRPVLYPWRVVGRRGRYFTGFKFRTMVQGADTMRHDLADRNEMSGPVFKMRDDPRVTRIGRFLRRYSLDEIPQLWSVLTGDMSLVGPRPPLQSEWEQFEPWQRQKLAVTPGITCLWQTAGRSEIQDFNEWVRLDLRYIERWNLWLDLRVLWQTLWVVVGRRGAY